MCFTNICERPRTFQTQTPPTLNIASPALCMALKTNINRGDTQTINNLITRHGQMFNCFCTPLQTNMSLAPLLFELKHAECITCSPLLHYPGSCIILCLFTGTITRYFAITRQPSLRCSFCFAFLFFVL